MGKYDKDRFQKELSVRFCIAKRAIPFIEVTVPSSSDLSDTVELLTDIDVLGVEAAHDGALRRTIFDCKTGNKLSAINRAFWARGVLDYAGCDYAYVILKNKAVHNHRISAIRMNVDLHDEISFKELGSSIDIAFDKETSYQSSIDNWNCVYDAYSKHLWTFKIFDLIRNTVPLSVTPQNTFRKCVAEIRENRGYFDPAKTLHVALFLETLASMFVLWSSMGRDIQKFYSTGMKKEDFESILRYYIWGGKEAYTIRRQMKEKLGADISDNVTFDMPAWPKFVDLASLLMSAPQNIFECAHISRELSFRLIVGEDEIFDKTIKTMANSNKRVRQFMISLTDYLASACSLPKDMRKAVEAEILGL